MKHACDRRTSTLILGIGRCICQIELVNGLVGVSLLPKSLPFHRSRHAQRTIFPRFLLVVVPLTYPSPADITVLYSRVLQQISGNLTLRIPTERVRSTAPTCKLRFYIENKPQKLFDFRSALLYGYPSTEVSCMNVFLAFEVLPLHEGKLSVCSARMHPVYPSNELTRALTRTRRRRSKAP